ncbi:MAG: hypothetical protein ACREBU_01375, partial [Nitrososphaera sp.]
MLAHDYSGFDVEHTEHLQTLVACAVAVVTRIVFANPALTIYLPFCHYRTANLAPRNLGDLSYLPLVRVGNP